MTWSDFYLVCFLVGFLLSTLSFLFGSLHIHIPHHGAPHLHLGGPAAHHGVHTGSGMRFPLFNFGTFSAFLAWFGGAGYLVTRYSSLWVWFGLGIAVSTGLAGAAIVFWFVARVLMASERDLDPADYELVGVLGRLCSPIREGGTGEMLFSRDGGRRVASARSEDGKAIPKGTEVVITRYEKGIAYVRRWEEFSGLHEQER